MRAQEKIHSKEMASNQIVSYKAGNSKTHTLIIFVAFSLKTQVKIN